MENSVLLHPTQGAMAVDSRENLWHTFISLQPDTVLFEVKSGPFDPSAEKEFASWAPEENAPDAAAYLESLEHAFRIKYRNLT